MIGVISWTCFYFFPSPLCHSFTLPPDPPQVTIVGYDNNWYLGRTNVILTCQATGNPHPSTVQWKTWVSAYPASYLLLCLSFLTPLAFSYLLFSDFPFFTHQSQVHRAVISAFIIATTAPCSDYGDSRIISHNGLCDSRFNPRIMRNTI